MVLGWGVWWLGVPRLGSDELVSSESEAGLVEEGVPLVAVTDWFAGIEESVSFFLFGEARELVAAGVVVGDECFFAVEDGWVV